MREKALSAIPKGRKGHLPLSRGRSEHASDGLLYSVKNNRAKNAAMPVAKSAAGHNLEGEIHGFDREDS